MNAQDLALFETTRPALMGIACRLLRSLTEAEDAVQDCFLRWSDSDRAGIASPVGWLKTICTRRCIDVLRTAHRSRVDYVGASLPDAADSDRHEDIDRHLPASLTIAFSQLLQRLSPKERAAYVLHELFEQPYRTIAATLQITPGACEKLVERARVHSAQQHRTRHAPPADTQRRLLCAFHSAIATGSPSQLALLLARDAHTKRRGSKASAVLRVLQNNEQPVHAPTQDLHGDHSDEVATSARADHWCERQDGPTSQRAA